MSGLRIGLVASSNDESAELVRLLEINDVQIVHNIVPENITDQQIADESIHVWLLNVDDDSWHDSVDHLLDESEIPVYFSEPGVLAKQTHPEYWCTNLVTRLFEITGLEPDETLADAEPQVSPTIDTLEQEISLSDNLTDEEAPLESALDKLEFSTVGLPSDIAAELVSELESISPVLNEELAPHQQNITAELEDTWETLDFPSFDDEKDTSLKGDSEQIGEQSLVDESVINSENIDSEHFDIESNDSARTESENTESEINELIDFDEVSNESNDESISFEESYKHENYDIEDLSDNESDWELGDSSSIDVDDFNLEDDVVNEIAGEPEDNQELSFDLDLATNDELDFATELKGTETNEESFTDEPSDKVTHTELSLQSTETEKTKISGRAQYIIDDDIDEKPSKQKSEKAADVEEEPGLTLQDIGPQKVTGKAQYVIDEGDEPVAKEIPAKKADPTASLNTGNLSLESIEDDSNDIESDADWLSLQEESAPLSPNKDSQHRLQLDEQDADAVLEDVLLEETLLEDTMSDSDDFTFEDLADNDIESQTDLDSTDDFTLAIDNEQTAGNEVEQVANEFDLSLEEFESHAESVNELQNESIELAEFINADIEEVAALGVELDEASIQQLAQQALDDAPTKVKPVLEENTETLPASTDLSDDEIEYEIPMLDETAFDIEFEEKKDVVSKTKSFTPCWVIGASLGGPAALKRFLSCIPADINASLIIAQHIDENFLPVLADILTSNSHFDVAIANGSNNLTAGKVFLAPLKGKLLILQDGSMLVDHSQKWSAPYSPCINDVIESVSQVYKERSGAIILSGMGDDGLNGAKKMHLAGGKIWAQSIDTCANSSMPEAIISNDIADYVGTPEQLAEQLVYLIKAR